MHSYYILTGDYKQSKPVGEIAGEPKRLQLSTRS